MNAMIKCLQLFVYLCFFSDILVTDVKKFCRMCIKTYGTN